MYEIKNKTYSVIAFLMVVFLCTNTTLCASATSEIQTKKDMVEKYYYALNSDIMERDTILLHEYNGVVYININDLCSLTRSTLTYENNIFTVTQGIWDVTFDYEQQQFSDGWQTVEICLINTGTYYLVPAIEFLTYFGANITIDKGKNTVYCIMPECTAWEALAIDYKNTLVNIYDLYGGEGNVKLSLTLDILMDFILNGTPNSDDYLLDTYNEALSINLCDYNSIQDYQKKRDNFLYEYLISDEGQDAADFASTLLDGSISGVEYLCETYYNTLNLKFADLTKISYQVGMLDESTYYASKILDGYRKKETISTLAETSKIPLTQIAPVFIQTALESAQQLKYATSTNNLAYHVMGNENISYLELDVGNNDWFRIANIYKDTATLVSNNFVGNAVDSFSDMGWEQLIGDCVQSFTGTSALLFNFSKECATSFAKWFPLTRPSVEAFESDRLALYLSELQKNVFYVISNIDFSNNYENEELYQKYIEANLLYCRVSIAMYKNLITTINEFGKNKEYWTSAFQERIDALAIAMYRLTLFQDDGAKACIPLDLLQFESKKSNEKSIFEIMPNNFTFSSGVGNWFTSVEIASDGTFIGQSSDLNMGEYDETYPNGTIYICDFDGKFSNPQQLNEYTYSTELENINIKEPLGTVYYEDKTKYICSEPFGFDNAKEFMIYLPNTPIDYLPESFYAFISERVGGDSQTLPSNFYCLYNINTEAIFLGLTSEEHIIPETSSTESKTDLAQYYYETKTSG